MCEGESVNERQGPNLIMPVVKMAKLSTKRFIGCECILLEETSQVWFFHGLATKNHKNRFLKIWLQLQKILCLKKKIKMNNCCNFSVFRSLSIQK